MRIAFVSNVVYPFVTGGAEKRIHEIGTRLADRGHDVTVYGRHFWDGPDEITHSGMTLQAVAPAADLYNDDRRSIAEAIDFAARARCRRFGVSSGTTNTMSLSPASSRIFRSSRRSLPLSEQTPHLSRPGTRCGASIGRNTSARLPSSEKLANT